ncbi:MAG TPA: VWA domain-containing protein [Kofleriaceae bacterium]|nr:VWA domain-containing protein [Kofleriaceae bacterium]
MRQVRFTPLAVIASIGGLAGTLLLAGCPAREVARVDPRPVKEGQTSIPVEINRDIDILFVIDNSGSMAEEQASLTGNFSRFINVLENIEGGLPNVHIGVVSSDVGAGPFNISGCSGNGDNGALQSAPRGACTAPSGAYIQDIDDGSGGRTRNYGPDTLADTFSCIARLGIDGCGFEQQLESARRALNSSNPTNQGFLRQNAFLAVIFITDEDDCSTADSGMFDTGDTTVADPLGPLSSFRCFEYGVDCDVGNNDRRAAGPRSDCRPRANSPYMYDPQEYVTFFKGLKDDPNMVIMAGIIGNPTPVAVGTNDMNNPELQPSCVSGSGEAAPGVRMAAFLDQFPQRSTVTTICNDDLSDALILVADLLRKVIGNPCIVGDIDTDPDTAGVQYECTVSDVRFKNTDRQEETILPECDAGMTNIPCWHLEPDAQCTDTETGLSLIVERGGGSVLTGTTVEVRCVVQ